MAGLWENIGKKINTTRFKTGRLISSVMNHEKPLAKDAVTLSIVAIVKNEADYIEEWIRYHLLVGITLSINRRAPFPKRRRMRSSAG